MRVILILIPLVMGVVYAGDKSSSWPIRLGDCKYPIVSSDFRVNDFFTNKWYTWRAYGNELFDRSGSCEGMESKIEGSKIHLLAFNYEPLLNKYETVRGESRIEYVALEGLYFPVTFKLFDMNFTTALTILGTDYENWAAFYFCKQGFGWKAEMSWLTVRDYNATVSPGLEDEMWKALDKVGLDYSDFQLQDRDQCGHGEPHL